MIKIALCALMVSWFACAEPFFRDANQLEIRKYRFGQHSQKGFERLVLEFDHLGTSEDKPKLSIETYKSEATITINQARLSGIIPESEINGSFLRKSRFLGPIAISSKKESFNLITHFKRASTVEAFWLDRPARLVIDVFSSTALTARTPARKIAQAKGSNALADSAQENIYCFPVDSQLQASIVFGKRLSIEQLRASGDSNTAEKATVVCFSADSRLSPQITFKSAPYPTGAYPTGETPLGITTDPVGGSHKTGPTAHWPQSTQPSAATDPALVDPMLLAPSSVLPPLEAVSAIPVTPKKRQPSSVPSTSVGPELAPSDVVSEPPTTNALIPPLPIMPSDISEPTEQSVSAGELTTQSPATATVFPKKTKRKRKKPELPQLPQSIAEGALLPPVK